LQLRWFHGLALYALGVIVGASLIPLLLCGGFSLGFLSLLLRLAFLSKPSLPILLVLAMATHAYGHTHLRLTAMASTGTGVLIPLITCLILLSTIG